MTTGLKCLITTYSNAFLVSGGGEFELVQVCEALIAGGIQTDIYGPRSRPLAYYDFAMHFSLHPSGYTLLEAVRKDGKKVLLWPNVWWLEKPTAQETERILAFIGLADYLLFKSKAERDNFVTHISAPPNKCLVVPTTILGGFVDQGDTSFAKTIVGTEKYLLCVGRVEPIKNQLEAIDISRRLATPLVILGGVGDTAYYQECKTVGGNLVKFLPVVQPRSILLASLYAACCAVVEVSLDPPGRSSLEAALFRKPLLLRKSPWVQEVFGETVYKVTAPSLDSQSLIIASWLKDEEGKVGLAHKRISARHGSSTALENFIQAVAYAIA